MKSLPARNYPQVFVKTRSPPYEKKSLRNLRRNRIQVPGRVDDFSSNPAGLRVLVASSLQRMTEKIKNDGKFTKKKLKLPAKDDTTVYL